MNLIKKGISASDMFSEPYKLNLNGQTAKKTVFGGILTLLCAITSLTIFFILGKEMFNRAKPRLNLSQKVIDDGTVRLKDLGLFWGYYGLYSQLISFDESFQKAIRIKASWLDFSEINSDISLTYKNLFIEKCTFSHFSDRIAAVYSSQKELVENSYCINPNKYELNGEIIEEEIVIKKPYTQNLSKSIWINTSYCDKDEASCDTSYVDKKDFFVVTRMAEFFIDGDDFSDPLKSTMKTKNLVISKGVSLVDYTTLRIGRADLDDGVVFENTRAIDFYSFSNTQMQIQIAKGEIRDMYDLVLDIDNKLDKVSRSYLKLQELAAQVAAFAKICVILFGFVGKLYNKSEIFWEVSCELNRQKNILDNSSGNQINKDNSTSNCCKSKTGDLINHSFFKFVKNMVINSSVYFAEVNKALSVRNVIQREIERTQRREQTIVFKPSRESN